MCDFEDMDLHQVQAKYDVGIKLEVFAGKSMEKLEEERIEADNQKNYKDKGGENE